MRLDVDPAWRAWLVDDEIQASCDEGWREILHDFFAAFHDVLVHEPQARVKVLQVKEKFAGLHVYWREEDVAPARRNELFAIYRRFEDLLPDLRDLRKAGRTAKAWTLVLHAVRGSPLATRLVFPPKGRSRTARFGLPMVVRDPRGRRTIPGRWDRRGRPVTRLLRPAAPPLDQISRCR